MAVFAIAAAGAWLAPAGYAALGWTIGMAVGNALFAKKHQINQEGPRLADLSVQTSTDGAPIMQVHGTARLAGNIIWSAGIKETKTESSEDVGGKGGGGTTVTTTTYTYSCSFALALCEGPIVGVRKIWADGKNIYNAASTSDPDVIAASSSLLDHMTLYQGTESQMPDPVIEAHEGAGNVPAYRGQAYLVFNDLALADFGNRIPNFTVEVVASGTVARMRRIQTWTRPSLSFVYEAGTILSQSIAYTSGGAFTHQMRRYALNGDLLESQNRTLSTLDNALSNFITCLNDPRLFVVRKGGTTINASALYGPDGQIARPIFPALGDDTFYSVWDIIVRCGSHLYARGRIPGGTRWIARYPLPTQASAFAASSMSPDRYVVTPPVDSFTLACSEQGDVYAYYNALGEIRRYDPDLNYLSTWTGLPINGDQELAILNGRVYLRDIGNLYEYILPAGGGAAVLNHTISAMSAGPMALNDSLLFDGGSIISLLDDVTPTATPLANVVTSIAQSAGLQSGDINTAALTGTLDGYILTQPMSARAALEPLMRAHFFDAIESGKQIKFIPRGGASAATIAEADLAARGDSESPPDAISIERDQELELPRAVTVLYMDPAADYQQGSQRSTRLITAGRAEVTVEMPMVLSADRARQIADVLLTDAWMARKRMPLALPPRYIDLEPTDVITVQGASATHTVRIIDQEIGANGVIRTQAVAESASAYTSTAVGAPPAIPAQALSLVGPTALHMLDVPLLRDLDDTPGCYLAAAGYLSGWKGAIIEQSRDAGESWSPIATKLTAAPMGYATTALAAPADARLWDHSGSVNVRLLTGTLSSSTEDGVIAGANLALLGVHGRWELLHFRDSVLEANGTWTLRSFLRGCFGTEYSIDKHAANDVFILVTSTSLLHVKQAIGDLNLALKYHALSIGAPAYTPATVDFTNTGLALRPYPVHNLAGIKQANGDWLIQWTPRVRKGQSWLAYANIAADPAITGYQVDIMSGTTVIRSVYVTGGTTFTYPAGGQQQDFTAVQSTLKVRVYAYSAQVGLGYGVEITAPTNVASYLAPVAFTAVAYVEPSVAPTDPPPVVVESTPRVRWVSYFDAGNFYGIMWADNSTAARLVVGNATATTWEVRGALGMGASRSAKSSSLHAIMVNVWFGYSSTGADGSWTYVQRNNHPVRNVGGGYYSDMVSDGTRFIVCGDRGILESTADFVTWTEHAVGQIGNGAELSVIRYGNGAYLVHGIDAGARKVWRSTDRVTWTDVTPAGFANHRIIDMAYASGKWVMVGQRPNQYLQTLPAIWLSTDNGLSWAQQADGGGAGQSAGRIAHNGSVFVVTGKDYRATSADGATWSAVYDQDMRYQTGRLVAGGSLILVADYNRSVLRKTTDGVTWTDVQ